VRKAFAVAKERKAVMDYDDLISLLSGRLQSDDGVLLAEQLQHQFPVALVDEFQDTDPQQYAILERLYPKGVESSALCMIGDPKQAIYSFRGGDIFTYLLARDHADHCWHMDTNWRSIDAMVQGYNRLFWGAPLDEEARPVFGFGIDYEQIKSTPKAAANEAPLKDGAVDRGAMNYVWFNPQQQPINAGFRAVIARWCCSEIDRLLTASVSLGERSVQERDIAILVRSAIEAEEMQAALRETGYASVYLSARDNLFAGEEAHELSLVLKGILNCEESRSLIAACSTRLLGGDAERLTALVSEADALVEDRHLFMALRNQWHEQGFLPMMMTLVHDHLSPSPVQHERTLTNYLHLAELLQKASGKLHHPQQLLEWLKERIKLNANDQEAELRLESDANLIRIITQHGSKGLEYPVVFVPFSSYPKDPIKRGNSEFEYYEYHDPESYRPLQIIGRDREAQALAREEGFAEAIRLLYVAVTRAEHRCYLCVAPFKESEDSPLARTLGLTESSEWQQQLQNLAATEAVGSRFIEVDEAEVGWVFRRTETVDGDQLKAETFRGEIDRNWRLSSFSALVRNVSHGRLDRREQDELTDATGAEEGATEIRFTLPKGADAGNLLHDVLEHCDFSEPDWSVVLPEPVMRFGRLDAKEEPALIGWLQECLDTELPAIGDRRLSRQSGLMLSQLKWASTLKESSFYFPLEEVCLPTLMEILQQHRGSNAPINLPERHSISGMMHGYIDLIFEQEGRFFVADYKSTHLGNRLTDYNYAALKRNNEEHFYDLQYLIYSLALHRYLSTQKQDYDPERDFGGVYYLYLRGMKPGSDSGVFHTAISPELLQQLDNLFSGEAAA